MPRIRLQLCAWPDKMEVVDHTLDKWNYRTKLCPARLCSSLIASTEYIYNKSEFPGTPNFVFILLNDIPSLASATSLQI